MSEEVKRLADYLKSVQPYNIRNFNVINRPEEKSYRYIIFSCIFSFLFTTLGLILWQPALAQFGIESNKVELLNNRITAGVIKPKNECSGSSSTSINVSNNSSQSSSTGDATISGNTTGGSATSGSSGNVSSTSTSITINNCN